ncbi:MAG: hypothetical protein ACREEE_06930 [Dongiaceae bacterium]
MVFRVKLVPNDFKVPDKVAAKGFALRKLTVHDVAADFEAIKSSAAHLAHVFGPRNDWPKGLTLDRNLADLGWHETEFENRTSFCWAVWTPDTSRYRGCTYIHPSQKVGVDAEIIMWVTKFEFDNGFDRELFQFFSSWIKDSWPFKNPVYPGRSLGWVDYDRLPNGQARDSQ